MFTKRLLAAFAVLALGVAGCGGGGDTGGGNTGGGGGAQYNLVSEGTLTVCSDIPYPPFEMEGDTGYTGFDIELIRAIADGIGLDVQIKDVGFEGLQSGTTLAAGTCDVAASAMTITEEREKNLDFSDPYYDAKQSLLVPKKSNISGIEDLAGKKVGVQQGTTGKKYTEENAPDSAKIVAFPSAAELFTALTAGQIDAILQDLPVNAEKASTDKSLAVVATFPTGEHYGFAVAEKGHDKLLQAINKQLKQLKQSGAYDKIYNKYFEVQAS